MAQHLPAQYEPAHVEVAQQRRERRALRYTAPLVLVAGRPTAAAAVVGLFHRRRQPLLDQTQHGPITDAPYHACHQFRMRNRVEVPAQVAVHHLRVPLVHQPMDLLYRVQRAAPGPVGILLRLQVGLEDRSEHQHCSHLRHAVPDRRDAQRSLFAVGLGYPYPTDRLRSIRLVLKCLRQFAQPSFRAIRLDVRERFPVHARRATIGFAYGVGVRQDVRPVQLVVQTVEAKTR